MRSSGLVSENSNLRGQSCNRRLAHYAATMSDRIYGLGCCEKNDQIRSVAGTELPLMRRPGHM